MTLRRIVDWPLQTYTLANGLRVVILVDHNSPTVAVNLWYHVGSKDETPKTTGLAHLAEHLMFEGSEGYDEEFFKPLHEAGASVNGSTNRDRTNYYEVVPAQFLELALWLEANRMGGLLASLTDAKLENQRQVVKNERRQRVDNQPYGRVSEELSRRLYPSPHPYSWPVIGWMECLDAFTLSDVRDFLERFYHPSNATLAIVGAVDADRVRSWIDRYFAPLAVGPTRSLTPPVAPTITDHRGESTEPVALPRVDLVWRTVPRFHADEPALDFAAHLLASRNKESRLSRALVREQRIATSVSTSHSCHRIGGEFHVRIVGLPGVDVATLEERALACIRLFAQQGPTHEEIRQSLMTYRNQAINRLETVLSQADLINHYQFFQGNVTPDALANELHRYESVVESDICKRMQEYLAGEPVVFCVTPSGAASQPTEPTPEEPAIRGGAKHKGGQSANLPGPGPAPKFQLSTVQRVVHPSGLRLVVATNSRLPRTDFRLLFAVGACADPVDKIGLCRLTTDLLDEGADELDGVEIARRLERDGATLNIGAGLESASAWLRCLTETRDSAFDLLAKIVRRPKFAQPDVDRERGRLLAELAHRGKQPHALADDAIDAILFGSQSVYGRPISGVVATIASLTRDDLHDFHHNHLGPERTTLLAVGDSTLDEVTTLVDQYLADWRSDRPSTPHVPPTNREPEWIGPLGPERVTIIDRPGAAQSVLRLGRRAFARNYADYLPALALNTILGGAFTSRLNLNLRESKGYTYGASSSFHAYRQGGCFVAGADVDSSATVAAVGELVGETLAVAREKPITEDELNVAKAYLVRRFPMRYETNSAVLNQLSSQVIHQLDDDYWEHFVERIKAITLDTVHRVAEEYLSPEPFRLVVVGDARRIGSPENLEQFLLS